MSNNKKTVSGRGDIRPLPIQRASARFLRFCLLQRARCQRRAWRTHAYRDSQVIFFGHDLPSEFLGRRR
jgi:hypothetical protein